ncbi:MAG: hypothetical protein C4K60_05420 [Ideonella sp. MAG2]|nr:MAG: hypothetical protein C4K60_05420 [Ideonella sp. MAG2]
MTPPVKGCARRRRSSALSDGPAMSITTGAWREVMASCYQGNTLPLFTFRAFSARSPERPMLTPLPSPTPHPTVTAKHLCWVPAGPSHSFSLGPGLHAVCGGEQRGKSSLLRVLAGQQAPLSGQLSVCAASCWYAQTDAPALDALIAQDWLSAEKARFGQWRSERVPVLAEALGLREHLHKPFDMLSAGSRRKVGLLGAAACGADLILLDGPYAALDLRSCRVVDELLREAASSSGQIWVLADYALPPGLDQASWGALIHLGN